MLDNGANSRFIQEMLGYTDLATTQIYTHVSVENLREIYAVTHSAKLKRDDDMQTYAPSRYELLDAIANEVEEK